MLERKWHTFEKLRAKQEQKLPAVLSVEELRRVLACVRIPHYNVFLTTVYYCGLRLDEAFSLDVTDFGSGRKMIHFNRGKGAKEH